jgi:3-deoxy-D-manno-oct-2-ulosonic acid (Kdo) hydroxylase
MPLFSISEPVADAQRAQQWCARLEAGGILYFPRTPIAIPPDDLSFLLSQQQAESGLHKNIAYKPNTGAISGLDSKTANTAGSERLRGILSSYSQAVEQFLAGFLLPYGGRWQLDYASFRPLEEAGRDLPLRRRNDLLHTDAFPTRPTFGARILRFFNNIHPSRTRDWVVSDPFGVLAPRYAPQQISLPRSDSSASRALRALATGAGLGKAIPRLKRPPYDDFMMRFHNFLKENESFQAECPKYEIQFSPGSSWMVYTDMVPHAVLSGQYALEQTFLIDHKSMVSPETSPLAVLEAMTGSKLA